MYRTGATILLSTMLGASLLTGCTNCPDIGPCNEENQRLKTAIMNYDNEIMELKRQIEAERVRSQKLQIALNGKDQQIALLKGGVEEANNKNRLNRKMLQQLQDLVHRLGGTLVDNRIQLSSDLFFDSGRYELKSAARPGLAELANLLASERLTLMVVGHTDSDAIGNPYLTSKGITTNRQLSMARAFTVLSALEESGYDSNLLYATGWGALKPRDTNDTKEGKANNRRVEIFIDPGMSQLDTLVQTAVTPPTDGSLAPISDPSEFTQQP